MGDGVHQKVTFLLHAVKPLDSKFRCTPDIGVESSDDSSPVIRQPSTEPRLSHISVSDPAVRLESAQLTVIVEEWSDNRD